MRSQERRKAQGRKEGLVLSHHGFTAHLSTTAVEVQTVFGLLLHLSGMNGASC